MEKLLVNARIVDGKNVIGYRFIGAETGGTKFLTRENTIKMAERGIIENMRVIESQEGKELRGRGINLKELTDIQKDGEARKVGNGIAPGCIKITRRITKGGNTVGFEVLTSENRAVRLSKADTMSEAGKLCIINAEPIYDDRLGIKGIRGTNGTELEKLPVLIIDENNKIVDPTKQPSAMSVRFNIMSRSGILKDGVSGKMTRFNKGDCLIFTEDGNISVITRDQLVSGYKKVVNGSADSDCFLTSIQGRYSLDVFADREIKVMSDIILKWGIAVKKA